MATGAGGGRARDPGELWLSKLKNATSLDDAGFVLTNVEEGGVPKVDKCGAADTPYAVNYRSTRDPHDMNEPPTKFLTGSDDILEGGITVFREGWARLKLVNAHAALKRGDPLVCVGGGKVNKYTPTTIGQGTSTAPDVETRFDELSRIVGHVEEDANIAAGPTAGVTQDKVLTKLSIRAVSINS